MTTQQSFAGGIMGGTVGRSAAGRRAGQARRRRLGIGAKLLLAFGTIAGLTVLAAVISWYLFTDVRENLALITDDSLPEIVGSFRLAEESAQLAASIPRLAGSRHEAELNKELKSLDLRLAAIRTLIAKLAPHGDTPSALTGHLDTIVQDVSTNIEHLQDAVQRSLTETRRRESLVLALANDQNNFTETIDPLINKARDSMITLTQRSVADGTAGISSLIDDSFEALRSILQIQANINFLISAMYQVEATADPKFVNDRRFAIVGPIAEIRNAFNRVPESADTRQLKQVVLGIIAIAIDQDNVFALRQRVLAKGPQASAQEAERIAARLAVLDAEQSAFTALSERVLAAVDSGTFQAAANASEAGRQIIAKTRTGIDRLERLLLLDSDVNQIVSILNQAATAIYPEDIETLRFRYSILQEQIDKLRGAYAAGTPEEALRPNVEKVLAYGTDEKSIMAARFAELGARGDAADLLRQSQDLASQLSGAAQDLVDSVESAASQATSNTLTALSRGEIILIVIAEVSLGAVALIAWLYVFRGIVRRLVGLSNAMLAIAEGDLDADIPPARAGDEICDMGRALVVFRENAIKRRQAEQKIREAKERAEDALTELQAAQRRLVQSEKMASLGQLTAGIAHEIKNPLNFVNNFAGLSRELLEELRDQLNIAREQVSPEVREEIDYIFGDLDSNLDKIKQHGQRADLIVRGMLDHSRGSSGTMEPTDLNALLEEFTGLAYHSLRAQNPGFNVGFDKDLDPDLPLVEAVPQDIGRVFLNIIANALQATLQKSEEVGAGYEPRLGIATRRVGSTAEIRIRDNGPGMPPHIQAKIFEPFFTTKPTGVGTGLGLSISYDIVADQHGGQLEVGDAEGGGAEFLIVLPLKAPCAAQPVEKAQA